MRTTMAQIMESRRRPSAADPVVQSSFAAWYSRISFEHCLVAAAVIMPIITGLAAWGGFYRVAASNQAESRQAPTEAAVGESASPFAVVQTVSEHAGSREQLDHHSTPAPDVVTAGITQEHIATKIPFETHSEPRQPANETATSTASSPARATQSVIATNTPSASVTPARVRVQIASRPGARSPVIQSDATALGNATPSSPVRAAQPEVPANAALASQSSSATVTVATDMTATGSPVKLVSAATPAQPTSGNSLAQASARGNGRTASSSSSSVANGVKFVGRSSSPAQVQLQVSGPLPPALVVAPNPKLDELIGGAWAMIEQGTIDAARRKLTQACKSDREDIRAEFSLGLVDAVLLRSWPSAEEHFSECVRRQPENVASLNNLALVQLHTKHESQAVMLWVRAVGRNSNSALSSGNLAAADPQSNFESPTATVESASPANGVPTELSQNLGRVQALLTAKRLKLKDSSIKTLDSLSSIAAMSGPGYQPRTGFRFMGLRLADGWTVGWSNPNYFLDTWCLVCGGSGQVTAAKAATLKPQQKDSQPSPADSIVTPPVAKNSLVPCPFCIRGKDMETQASSPPGQLPPVALPVPAAQLPTAYSSASSQGSGNTPFQGNGAVQPAYQRSIRTKF